MIKVVATTRWGVTSWVVGGTDDAGEALSTWVVRDVADAEGRRGRRGWLGAPRTRVGRYRRGSCMTWQTRRGVVVVVGGWGHRGCGWVVIEVGGG